MKQIIVSEHDKGQRLDAYITSSVDDISRSYIQKLIKEDIIEAVNKYEPRIFMNENDISIVQNQKTVEIYIQYEILQTGEINQYNMEITADDNPYK